MISIGILGSQGKMGNAIQALLKEGVFPNLKCGALFDKSTPPSLSSVQPLDVLIDFTEPKATMSFLSLLKELKKPVVIGTTGFSEEEKNEIQKFSRHIPIVLSPNMSIGVNVLFDLVQKAETLLPSEFSSHILEIHHPHKKDSPSGTALKLKEKIQRPVSIESIRGGDVVGEHTVYFLSQGERLELTHKATSRTIFARGALKAAEWVIKQKPGLYSIQDVLKGHL